jgi:hypothetical protein
MDTAHRGGLGTAVRALGQGWSGRLAPGLGLGLAALISIASLAGCVDAKASPIATPSTVASFEPSETPNPTETSSSTPVAAPTVTQVGAFAATGKMIHPRLDATATLLANGKVLIAGGTESIGGFSTTVLASAELYDPGTGAFSETGSMTTDRTNHTATLLQNGEVLIAGGWSCPRANSCSGADPVASAELYDPKTGKFHRTGSMFAARTHATATLLADGRVLIAAGAKSPETAELYDPASGKFVRTGKLLSFSDVNGAATLLPNGKVLLTGSGAGVRGAYLYSPTPGVFTLIPFTETPGPTASPTYKGQAFRPAAPDTLTVLEDGRVLLFERGYLETYDPAAGVFAAAGFLAAPEQWRRPTATLLANGKVLFTGGWRMTPEGDSTTVALAGLYDPVSGPELLAPMPGVRSNHTATLLPDGTVLIAGGSDDSDKAFDSAELFRP